MHPSLAIGAAVAGALATPLVAQSFQAVPHYADTVDGHQSLGLPFGKPGFRSQILVEGAAIAASGGILTSVSFRADRWLAPVGATQVPNVTVQVSHTSVAPGGLAATFATNVTGPVTTVFQGTVNLPAQGLGFAGPLPWNIVIPFAQPFPYTNAQGNLLIDITGNNPAAGSPSYFLDAVQAGGTATQFGASGQNPTFDTLLLIVSTGGSIEPRQISPGHTIDFTSTLFFSPRPGVVALGTSPHPVPIDLGPIGAPTNSLFFDPILFATHNWTQSFIGWASTFSLVLPPNPLFLGATIYGQSAILEPLANPLGLILSHGVETRIGDEFEALLLQQVDSPDPNAASGTLVDFGSTGPERGAVAIRIEGTFF